MATEELQVLGYECTACGYRHVLEEIVREHVSDTTDTDHDAQVDSNLVQCVTASPDPSERESYSIGYTCTQCDYTGRREEDAIQHAADKQDDVHSNINTESVVEEMTAEVSRTTFEAVYVLNKKAKEFAEKGTKQYRQGRKGKARISSEKKQSLYGAKSELLQEICDMCDCIKKNELNGGLFYCLYFTDEFGEQWSFHVPTDEIQITKRVTETEELDDFSKSTAVTRTTMSLTDALQHLKDKHCIDANRHVPRSPRDPFSPFEYRTETFTGWDCL